MNVDGKTKSMTNEEAKDHYSIRVYAEPEVARAFDRERFSGAIGEFIKKTQENLVFSRLPEVKGWKVADIGAGTGRVTIPFLEAGASVSACDASVPMLEVLKEAEKEMRMYGPVRYGLPLIVAVRNKCR